MSSFKIISKMKPAGDQPQAIDGLVSGLQKNMRKQTLLGVTGSGKTFTIANVIERVQKPTLVIAHNKTLAAQLCNEFRDFFPNNAVEYFVSYYDYYQPEAYMPHSDTYIEKEAMINKEIDRLRHACTQALLTRDDVIIVASVSAIYGLGSPTEYEKIVLHLRTGQKLNRREMLEQLISMQFIRTNSDLERGSFRLTGQVFEIMPVNEEMIYRFEISEQIDAIEQVDPVTRAVKRAVEDAWIFPAKHYVVNDAQRELAFVSIKNELEEQLATFQKQGKVLEYERLKRRVNYDLEMIKNVGYCSGIENYSRHFDARVAGEPPFSLLDYFRHSACHSRVGGNPEANDLSFRPSSRERRNPLESTRRDSSTAPSAPLGMTNHGGYLTVIDESHVTLPQIRGMYFGDKARKDTLVEHGFRLPSARDNRPLTYDEFEARTNQVVYVSATPAETELKTSEQVVEQIVRPTGLIDPEVIIRPVTGGHASVIPTCLAGRRAESRDERRNPLESTRRDSSTALRSAQNDKNGLSQIEDLMIRIDERVKQNERVLVTTLTKKMAEDLSEHLDGRVVSPPLGGRGRGGAVERKIKVKYLHSDIKTIERISIITDLRLGKIDVIVGVNLLREGLDMPEVSLVAILDADKEGFLRNDTSLIQTIGRAARNVNGRVILYADNITGSIKRAVQETDRRRKIQLAYNKKHGITPKTIEKAIRNILEEFGITEGPGAMKTKRAKGKWKSDEVLQLDLLGDARPIPEIIREKEKQMKEAAKDLEFELAAILRDEVRELRKKE
ncbi:MAG: excinuclease ABC subunit UvrB [bacterium]|nr:excinuclease ABC subunit UvrB [bacterium]